MQEVTIDNKTMRKMLLPISFLCLLLSASTCQKENDECHKTIKITNSSDSTVIYSTILYDGSNSSNCLLSKRAVLKTGERFEESLRVCWENELKIRDFEFYIVDTSGFNDEGFYPCDSIEKRNTILKKYELSLEDLQMTDFRVIYP